MSKLPNTRSLKNKPYRFLMAKLQALRTLVAERLAAAAEEVFSVMEKMVRENMLHTSEMSPEEQRAVVQKRLSVVADEIFRILEIMLDEWESEVKCARLRTDKLPVSGSDCDKDISSEKKKCEQSRSFSLVHKVLDPPHLKDASTETDSELRNRKRSHFHHTRQAGKGSSVTEIERQGEHCRQGGPSPQSSETVCENNNSDKEVSQTLLKPNKRRRVQNCKMSETSLHKELQKKKAPANKNPRTRRSCCRVCGKFFRYKRSFLKHALTHEQTAGLCGVCGKRLESDERLKVHLQTHNEEKDCRDEAGDNQSEAEAAVSTAGVSDGGSDNGGSDRDAREGSCLQKTESKTETEESDKFDRPQDCTDLSDPKYSRKVRDKSLCYRSAHFKHARERKKDSDLRGKPSEAEESSNLSQTTSRSCCRVCGKSFHYNRSFLKHALRHEQSTDLCGVCGKHLESDETLKVHLQKHNEENSCRDPTDDRQVEDMSLESELGESDEDKSEGSDSDNGESYKEETKERKSKPKPPKNSPHLKYCCKVCAKSFCYRASFLKHVQEDESEADLCGVCGKHFENEESLRLHLQTHTRTNDCEVCGKHFDGHKQLEMHARTHTGEKPFVCSVCGKAFAQNGNLTGHMRVHTREKPYICSVCGQSFSFKEYMRAHMRIHTGEKPFLCSICGKGFRQRGTLKTHTMIHTGESAHRCAVCDKKFYKSGALKIHMRSHTGEKPYLCNVCGKSFSTGGSLTKHMGVHEGERTHCCSVCGKGFPRRDDLKRHAQTHGDESARLTSL
ncbi:zinc finger protein 879-like [Mugil cephalus]|uniref:zinc finger protein 879-like n=1 Tax=Mugil cephalus TaxID=48193 RepID=UPI001FB6866B|nr:zinc finger protein 879-like [Mugil cephalus]